MFKLVLEAFAAIMLLGLMFTWFLFTMIFFSDEKPVSGFLSLVAWAAVVALTVWFTFF